MEAHLALTQLNQVNKVTTSSEICSDPHDTQYCMEDPKQAFVEYASSCTDEAGGSTPINRGLIQAILTSLPPQPIGEATKTFYLRRIPPRV
ncbi:hypothetical protein Tco_1097375 [Tanacetum coccineum]